MKIEPGMLCRIHAPGASGHGLFVIAESTLPRVNITVLDGRRFRTPTRNGPYWLVTGRAIPTNGAYGLLYLTRAPCAEYALRPIIDPGDDAVDEMVLIAGKPKQHGVVFDALTKEKV